MGKKSLAALLCATMAMTACMLPATAAMADEPLKIEFFQQKGEEGPQKGYKEIIDKFNKENSDIEIEIQFRMQEQFLHPEFLLVIFR
jgi:raffinose/stachyose/melibiose transport system substrate-binding protein